MITTKKRYYKYFRDITFMHDGRDTYHCVRNLTSDDKIHHTKSYYSNMERDYYLDTDKNNWKNIFANSKSKPIDTKPIDTKLISTKRIICNLTFNSNCVMMMYIRINDKCMLIGEGKTIKFPIIYEHDMNNIFLKFEANPDKIIDELKMEQYATICTNYRSLGRN